MHVLPELAALEAKYVGRPVAVVGVHSAKFDNEKVRQACRWYLVQDKVLSETGPLMIYQATLTSLWVLWAPGRTTRPSGTRSCAMTSPIQSSMTGAGLACAHVDLPQSSCRSWPMGKLCAVARGYVLRLVVHLVQQHGPVEGSGRFLLANAGGGVAARQGPRYASRSACG